MNELLPEPDGPISAKRCGRRSFFFVIPATLTARSQRDSVLWWIPTSWANAFALGPPGASIFWTICALKVSE